MTHPMPPQIARLSRFGSVPVPWTVQWSSGAEHIVQRETGPVLVCTCKAGKGRPRFASICVNHQRQAIQERRCAICGIQIGPEQACTWPLVDTRTHYYFEAPTHSECLAFALRVCPKLASLTHRSHVVQAHDYTVWERRAIGTGPDGPVFEMVPLGDPSLGVVEFYALTPFDPVFTPTLQWLADHTRGSQ